MSVLINAVLFFAALFAMEGVAWVTHKYVMHGWGWGWHESHHRDREGAFEKNDLYAVVFSLPSIALIYIGVNHFAPALWVGLGILAYGLVYFIFHDVIVHKRLKTGYVPKSAYMKRIVQAHRLHHAVHTKEGTVSFGFVFAPRVDHLKAELKRLGSIERSPRNVET